MDESQGHRKHLVFSCCVLPPSRCYGDPARSAWTAISLSPLMITRVRSKGEFLKVLKNLKPGDTHLLHGYSSDSRRFASNPAHRAAYHSRSRMAMGKSPSRQGMQGESSPLSSRT